MLEIRKLTKYYGAVPAVEDVSFSIRPGEVLGYLGPNGSGKSTTVKMIIGLLEPTRGSIFYQGQSVREDWVSFRRKMGYVPEEPNLYPHLTGFEYLQLAGRLRGIEARRLRSKIHRFLDLFGLADAAHEPLQAYSKGMRQKILLSSALLHDPEFLILDEPFSGLDVSASLVFRTLLQELAAAGKIILYSSHVLEVVERICTTVLILNRGTVAGYDSVARLREMASLPSLEEVFAQLTRQDDASVRAGDILLAMKD